jgi:hypothetical protein
VSGAHSSRGEPDACTEPTLDELARKLSELRQHLEQVLRGLDLATSGARAGDSRAEESSLRCHACRRAWPRDEVGWTLRLCGDDELHPFCPACDGRHVDGDGGGQMVTDARLPL